VDALRQFADFCRSQGFPRNVRAVALGDDVLHDGAFNHRVTLTSRRQ
jgi:hypothetical protein